MKQEQQRIAIAEACGWERLPAPVQVEYMWRIASMTTGEATWRNPSGEPCLEAWLPQYVTDLNAMHEAEFAMGWHGSGPPNKWHEAEEYKRQICIASGCACHSPISQNFSAALFATAAQRAEAFLRTIGKWQEQPPDCGG